MAEILEPRSLPDTQGEGPHLLKTAVLRAQLQRLALRGLNAKQAATALGCGYWLARAAYADPGFRETVMSSVNGSMSYADERFAAEKLSLHSRLAQKSEEAFERLCEMLDDAAVPAGLRIRIAQDFLDRNPDTSRSAQVAHTHEHRLSPEDLVLAARTAEEMALREAGRVVEIRKVG